MAILIDTNFVTCHYVSCETVLLEFDAIQSLGIYCLLNLLFLYMFGGYFMLLHNILTHLHVSPSLPFMRTWPPFTSLLKVGISVYD